LLTGSAISNAKIDFSSTDITHPIHVQISFNSEGAKKFAEITRNNVKRRLAIVLDGKVKTAPVIEEEIATGRRLSEVPYCEEAQDVALVLRVGALPAPMTIEEERTVGPLLGQDSIKNGVRQALVGGFLFLVLWPYIIFWPVSSAILPWQ